MLDKIQVLKSLLEEDFLISVHRDRAFRFFFHYFMLLFDVSGK